MATMTDSDVLYQWAERIGKRPTEDQEDCFIETVGKLINDGMDEHDARRNAFKRLYEA